MIHPEFVGCDVSKHHLDLFDRGVSRRIDNSEAACAALAGALSGRFVVFEATGGYDQRLAAALTERGVAFARVNPGRARDFARAAGFLAKTDKVDAQMLAAFGAALRPDADAAPEHDRAQLATWVKRRDQLVKMRIQERVRASECASVPVRADIDDHLAWLDQRIKRLNADIAALIKSSAALRAQIARLQTAPGVGQVTATVLAALMPELGARSPKAIAALAGLAPLNADSGQKRGGRMIKGGRRRVREALYMAALSAVRWDRRFAAFYAKLRAAGKAAKLALIAVARKLLISLNAMLRDNLAYAA